MIRHSLVSALVLSATASLWAQPETPEGLTIQVNPRNYVYTFSPKGISLADAITTAADAAKRPIMFQNRRALEGKVLHIDGAVTVPIDEAWAFWQAVFVANGFAVVEEPGAAGVLRLEPIDSSRSLKQRAEYVHYTDVPALKGEAGRVIMTSIPLQHVPVANVRQAVTQVLTNRQAEFTQEVAGANALIVVGFCPTVYAVYQLVRAMDAPFVRMDPEIASIQLQHAVASEAQKVVTEIMGMRAAAPQPGRAVAATSSMLAVATDDRTNSLVVSGSEEAVARIRAVVELLDVEVEGAAKGPENPEPVRGRSNPPGPARSSGGVAKEFDAAVAALAKFRKEHGVYDFDAQVAAARERAEEWALTHERAIGSDVEGPLLLDERAYKSRKHAIAETAERLEEARKRFAEFQKLWADHERLDARLERARARYVGR